MLLTVYHMQTVLQWTKDCRKYYFVLQLVGRTWYFHDCLTHKICRFLCAYSLNRELLMISLHRDCQYQCNQLPGKTRPQNDLLCVEWDVKPYTLTHSLHHQQLTTKL